MIAGAADRIVFFSKKNHIYEFKHFFKCAMQIFFSLKAHYLAGNHLLIFWQPGVSGCPEVLAGAQTPHPQIPSLMP